MHTANGLKPMGGGPVSTTSTVDPRRPYCRIMDDAAVVRSSTLPNPVRNVRTNDDAFAAMSTVGDLDKRQLIERCVVITKQPDGYGLTVTGENPVFVDYVKPEGAAYFAGVRQGDRILKVNGMPVSRSNHHEVVRMISDGQNVVLALLGKPTDYSTTPHAANGQTAIMTQGAYDYEIPNSTEDIRRRQIDKLNEMLRTERSYIESIQHECGQEDRVHVRLALERIRVLEQRLRTIKVHEEHQNPAIVEPVKSWVDSGGMHYIPAADVGFMGDVSEEDDNEIHHHNSFDQSSFMNLEELKSRPAHLASFINFLLNNSNPSSLLFHLITDAYQSANSPVKELRRFAYEIFSTFLIPNAPLAMANISQPLIQAMDKILKATVNATDQNVDQLRKIFVPARTRALDDINECLADFRQKRQYGPDANQLDNIAKGDHAMEYRVSEQMLMKTLETLYNSTNGDLENCEARLLALIMSVATVIKVTLGMRPNLSAWEKLLEKCPTFLTNSKSSVFKMKPMISKRVVQVKGHHFVLNPVNLTVHCYQCRDPVWGVNAQAYFCQNCDVSVHKQCAAQLTDHCYPATQQKNKSSVSKNSKKPFTSSASNLLGGSTSSHSRHESPSTSSTIDNLRAVGATSQPILAGGTVTLGHLDRSTPELRSIIPPPVPSSSVPPPPPQVPPPWGTAMAAPPTNVVENAKSTSSDSGIGTEVSDRPVFRSHSMRSKAEIVRQPSRGKSTPTPWNAAEQLGPPPDEAYEEPISSSFRRVDVVMDERPPALLRAVELGSVSGSSSLSQHSGNEEETRRMLERVMQTALAEGDSDLEVETEVPALESIISWEIIRHLKPKEKKRQEVVNELFHTERTHVRNLKIIARVFYKPLLLKQIVSADIIRLIFANLEDVLDIHMEIWHKMKLAIEMWQRDPAQNGLYGEIGELIEGCFQGSNGDRLMRATAMFCQNQQFALDYLRKYYGRSKDDPFSAFLIEAESNPLCRKLQLKDMLPMEMQRLVKYPMLLETIAKYTKDPSTEQTQLLNSVNCAKRILAAVNTAKRNTENHRRLDELQRRVDTTNFDSNDQLDAFLQSFDFTKHQLIYEGSLTWRISRTKMVDFHVVLLEHLIVFLTKTESGKLQLRTQDVDTTFTPLLNLAHFAVTCKSTDKRLFSLFRRHDLRVFEFIAPTVTERKTWQRLIEAQIRACPQADDRSYELPFSTSMTSMPYPSLPTTEEKKIERVHVVTHPRLVSANEITIVQPTVFEHAQPVLTPNERLRRHDKLIMDALIDKQKILASFMGDGKDMEELNNMADTLATLSVGELKLKSSKELAMSAIVQGNRLLDLINKEMNPKKDVDDKSALNHAEHLPSVPCYRLTAISAQLMNHLMALLQVIQDQTSEMTAVRQQLHHFKDLAGPGVRTVSEETLTEPPPLPPPLPPSM